MGKRKPVEVIPGWRVCSFRELRFVSAAGGDERCGLSWQRLANSQNGQ
jgi:hypothetical protein